jgi:hypothetical protein
MRVVEGLESGLGCRGVERRFLRLVRSSCSMMAKGRYLFADEGSDGAELAVAVFCPSMPAGLEASRCGLGVVGFGYKKAVRSVWLAMTATLFEWFMAR